MEDLLTIYIRTKALFGDEPVLKGGTVKVSRKELTKLWEVATLSKTEDKLALPWSAFGPCRL